MESQPRNPELEIFTHHEDIHLNTLTMGQNAGVTRCLPMLSATIFLFATD